MAPRTSTFWCFLLYFVPGVYGIDEALVGAICSGAVAAVVLFTTLIICVVLWYMSESSKRPKKKPKYDMNGNAMQNGIPLKEHARKARPVRPVPVPQPRFVPRSYRGMPVGSYRGVPVGSYRGVPVGSFRGPPPEVLPGSYRGAPPGMVLPGTYRGAPPGILSFSPRGPYPAMDPYFFRPVIYLDESDDDEHSMRSTVKERKKRYHRSMNGTGGRGRPSSGVIIKEVENTEEKVLDVSEDRNKQTDKPGSPRRYRKSKSRSRSRSRSPDKPRSKPSSRPQSLGKSQKIELSTSYRNSYRKPDSDDEAAQIDEMFSGFSAVPKEGDIVFQKAEPKTEKIRPITPPRTPPRTPTPVRDEPPLVSNYQYASVIRQSEPEQDMQPFSEEIQQRDIVIETDVYSSVIKSTEPDDTNLYSSVIKKDNYNHDRGNPLRQSMAERLEEIVQNRHEGRPTEFDENQQDEDTYPVKSHSLSHTQRSEIAASRREGTSNFLSQSRRRSNGSEEYRPETPPDDYPMISPRESFIRSEAPASTRVPEIDLGVSPRPATPPFDVTDRSEKPVHTRMVPEQKTKQDFKGAFSDQVLQELRRRQQSTSNDDDDDDEREGRAVNFSAHPPEIIPRSEPNSPRTSMNIPQNIAPPPPVITPGVIPPAPPPPPPPPPPPVPK